ncbi:MAG: hypothetical protein OEM80_10720, partial [Desulfobulbaceae bacterium]|nr:hypothetical protein [Desulfobulbaceae bacterium]
EAAAVKGSFELKIPVITRRAEANRVLSTWQYRCFVLWHNLHYFGLNSTPECLLIHDAFVSHIV